MLCGIATSVSFPKSALLQLMPVPSVVPHSGTGHNLLSQRWSMTGVQRVTNRTHGSDRFRAPRGLSRLAVRDGRSRSGWDADSTIPLARLFGSNAERNLAIARDLDAETVDLDNRDGAGMYSFPDSLPLRVYRPFGQICEGHDHHSLRPAYPRFHPACGLPRTSPKPIKYRYSAVCGTVTSG